MVAILLGALLYVGGIFIFRQIENQNIYNSAEELLNNGNYGEAIEAFNSLGDYKDAKEKAIKAYGENFNQTAALIYANNLLSQLKCYYISEIWSLAIKDKWKDFSTEVNKLIKRWDENALTASAEESKSSIDEKMIALQNPVHDYVEAHKLLIEMYGLYVQMYEQSKSPTGSLLTYNSAIKNIASDFEKAYN